MADFVFALAEQFRMEVFELGALVIAVVLLALITQVVRAIVRTEAGKNFLNFLEAIDPVLQAGINMVENGVGYDDNHWESVANSRAEADLPLIDARMLFVLDRAEKEVEKWSGIDFDFDMLHDQAEHILSLMKLDDSEQV